MNTTIDLETCQLCGKSLRHETHTSSFADGSVCHNCSVLDKYGRVGDLLTGLTDLVHDAGFDSRQQLMTALRKVINSPAFKRSLDDEYPA